MVDRQPTVGLEGPETSSRAKSDRRQPNREEIDLSRASELRIGEWIVEPDRLRLIGPKGSIPLRAKVMALLVYFATRPQVTISRDELLGAIWGGRAVSDDVLKVSIYALRKALGDRTQNPRYLKTVRGRGYIWLITPTFLDHQGLAETGATEEPVRSMGTPALLATPQRWIAIGGLAAVATLIVFVLGQGAPTDPSLPLRSIAVLPLTVSEPRTGSCDIQELLAQNETGTVTRPLPDPSELIADSLTDTLTDMLGRQGSLRVTAPTSSRRIAARSRGATKAETARVLNVEAILTGSVTRCKPNIQVQLRLVDTSTSGRLWNETFDAAPNNLAQLPRQIAQALTRALGQQPVAPRGGDQTSAISPAALGDFLHARRTLLDESPGATDEARRLIARAVEQSPGFAQAYTAMAGLELRHYEQTAQMASLDRARDAVRRAVALDPTDAEAYATRGALGMIRWDWDAAEHDLQLAIRLNPSLAPAHVTYAWLLSAQGRHVAAKARARAAVALDPLRIAPYVDAAMLHHFAGEPAGAIEAIAAARDLGLSLDVNAWQALARAHEALGEAPQAVASYLSSLEQMGLTGADLARLRETARQGGLVALDRACAEAGEQVPARYRVQCLARIGEAEAALDLLEQLVAARDSTCLMLAVDPGFAALRSEARFRELTARVGLDF